jgi:putative FmdB family regulatory protein
MHNMPLYEYKCTHCNHTTEVLTKIGNTEDLECPMCKQIKLSRQISAPNFKLKGTGWYETDFKDKPKKPEHKNNDNSSSNNEEK